MGLDETHIEGAHHGTLSHMAPDVVREGRQSTASDVCVGWGVGGDGRGQ